MTQLAGLLTSARCLGTHISPCLVLTTEAEAATVQTRKLKALFPPFRVLSKHARFAKLISDFRWRSGSRTIATSWKSRGRTMTSFLWTRRYPTSCRIFRCAVTSSHQMSARRAHLVKPVSLSTSPPHTARPANRLTPQVTTVFTTIFRRTTTIRVSTQARHPPNSRSPPPSLLIFLGGTREMFQTVRYRPIPNLCRDP